MHATYSEKLKDPRWQKLRLEILQRDKWTCQKCFSKDKTLHVHHIAYTDDDPWDSSPVLLLTLCHECHEAEGPDHKAAVASLLLLLSMQDIKTASALQFFVDVVETAYCQQQTGDWYGAWKEGLSHYFTGGRDYA